MASESSASVPEAGSGSGAAQSRIQSVLEQLPLASRPAGVERLPEMIERAERLRWSGWSGAREDAAPASTEASAAQLRDALARARPSSEGGAYTAVFTEDVSAAADRLERAPDPRPLAGMPVAVKDLIAIAGNPLTGGSAVRWDAPPEPEDSHIVKSLRGLGAVIMGAATLHEFAFGLTGVNHHAGTAVNPTAPDRITGGSSSGSAAAVAEGSAAVGIGTDTGGSGRLPAAMCGVVGYKPAFGLYPMGGVRPHSLTLDHLSLFTSDVATVCQVHAALGFRVDPPAPPARLGVVEAQLDEADSDVASRVAAALRALEKAGCQIVPVAWPHADETAELTFAISHSEAAAIHRETVFARAERYGADVLSRLLQGLAIPAHTYVAALQAKQDLARRVADALDGVDAVVGPTVPSVPPLVEEAGTELGPPTLNRNTRLGNLAGIPALSLPAPGDGLPVGIQVMARQDHRLLGFCAWIERQIAE